MIAFQRWVAIALISLTTSGFAQVITYDSASEVLSIPSVRVGNETYINVSFRRTNQSGYTFSLTSTQQQIPAGEAVASYDPNTGTLTLPSVQVGDSTYIYVTLRNIGNYTMVLKTATLQAPLPRLQGTGILPHQDWANLSSSRWSHVTYLSNAGVNVVRLFLQPFSVVDGSPLLQGQPLAQRLLESLKQWESMLTWCDANNIFVIFTVNLEQNYPSYGAWPGDGRSLWKDASAQSEFVAAWSSLATRFAGTAGMIFDLLNEPHGITTDEIAGNHALPKAVWNTLHAMTLAEVRRIDPNRWLIVEPVWGEASNFVDLRPSGDAKTIYSFHFYSPHYFTHQGNSGWPAAGTVHYPGVTQDASWQAPKQWSKAELASLIQPAIDFSAAHSVRVMLGEMGSSRGAPPDDRAKWTADVLSLVDPAGFDIVYFQYDGWGVPSDFALGWAFENSPVEPLLLTVFARNKVQ